MSLSILNNVNPLNPLTNNKPKQTNECETSADKIFLNVAKELSQFSKCQFTKVACVIVNERGRIVSTGVNGTISGSENCCEVQFNKRDDHKGFSDQYEIHAEMNAILELVKNGTQIGKELSVYCTINPCWNCLKHIIGLNSSQTRITKIVYSEQYHRMADVDIANMKKFCSDHLVQFYQVN